MIVIGNGESRKGIDLDKLPGIKIGCNSIYKEMFVDHLVCVDRRPFLDSCAARMEDMAVWTRADYIKSEHANPLPVPPQGGQRADNAIHWGSGPYAVLLATLFSNNISLIGFDLYSSNGLVNNIYKDTSNYSAGTSIAVDPKYWIYQISRVFMENTDKYFQVYNKPDWQIPESWRLANVEFKTLDKLNDLY